jgi:hypothetical protein
MSEMADRVRHVRLATQSRAHTCHWPGCTKQVPPAMWGCKAHWFKLPQHLRNEIWRTYRAGQEIRLDPSDAYLVAARAAEDWIREHHPPLPPAA